MNAQGEERGRRDKGLGREGGRWQATTFRQNLPPHKDERPLTLAGLLSETTMENLKDLPVQKLIVTNSIDQTDRIRACDGMLGTIDIAPVIAESIRRTHNG